MTQWALRAVLFAVVCVSSQARGEVSRGVDHFVIDGVKIPFGKVIEVSGPCLRFGSSPVQFGVSTIRGLRIDGKANQDEIEFHLSSPDPYDAPTYKELESLKPGTSYKARGRLMNGRTVGPYKAMTLVVDRIEMVPTAPLRFSDFANRVATFEGTAALGGTLKTKSEQAQVGKLTAWPKSVDGKSISVSGTLRANQIGWRIEAPSWKLVKLDDQIGQSVTLDGFVGRRQESETILWNQASNWSLEYRGHSIYLTTPQGPGVTFADNDKGRRVRVSGHLVRQDRVIPKPGGKLFERSSWIWSPVFVIRAAKVEYLEDQSTWKQKYEPVYSTFHSVQDGVPVLLAEFSFRGNAQTNPATATLYASRNDEVIRDILDKLSPRTREVLARRMNDSKLPNPIRLLYAAMLASANDKRGRSFLIASIKEHRPETETFIDALYCLGAFPSLASKQAQARTDVEWAEETMIALMTDRRPVNVGRYHGVPNHKGLTVPVAKAVVIYSSIPSVLLRINSAPARNVLIDFAVANESDNSPYARVIDGVLLDSNVPLPIDDLAQLESLTMGQRFRREAILSQFLRQKQYSVAERFVDDLESDRVYSVFRDHLSPELTTALRPCIKRVKGEAKDKVQMLVLLGERDPVPVLINMLDDPDWKNKELVLSELARLQDGRAVGPIARILRVAPRDYFNTDATENCDWAVKTGLRAISKAETRQAIRELIELLPVDLARFGTDTDRNGFQKRVAAHLVELTGESFCADVEAWRDWQRAQRANGLKP